MSATEAPRPLGTEELDRLPATISRPGYDRRDLARSIVHIGVGGFHRAHLATYVHELCEAGHRGWAIVGAGLLPGDRAMAEALRAQDHLYCLIVRGDGTSSVEVIGSIVDYVYAADSTRPLVERIADPTTQLVSLTITEGGYPVDDETGAYDPGRSSGSGPFAVIAEGLDERRRRSGSPLTILSCDNIVGNGAATRASTIGEAARLSADLEGWVTASVSFPNSMVDRITPQTTDADRAWLTEKHGLIDRWPVVTEPFRQWVVEDAFAGARPPFEELDVTVTSDVAPYEVMKLRMLNAAHSCLAYLAALAGIPTVDEVMGDRVLGPFVAAFIEREAKPVVPPIPGVDLDAYQRTLVARFSNSHISDQVARLCLDGTAKFPKFLLPTVREQLRRGGPISLSALALAAWCEYLCQGVGDREGRRLAPDPMLDLAIEHAVRSTSEPTAFLDFAEVFGHDLPADERFAASFATALTRLRSGPVRPAIEAALADTAR